MIGRRPYALLSIPIALLATGCALEAYTPAVVPPGGEQVPLSRSTTLPSYYDASLKWELPVRNPWAPYVKLTLLSALDAHPRAGELPDVESLEVVERARKAAVSVASTGLPDRAMWVVDLRGAASVAFGAALSQRASEAISPVITFNNWPAEHEVVPAEETLAALIAYEPRIRKPTLDAAPPTLPVFLLDSWRLAYREEEPSEDLTDNRYMLTPSDLPSVEVLRAQGIERVVYVVERFGEGTVEEDDLNATFIDYQQAGITIHIVDLDWLTRTPSLPETARWIDDLPNVAFYVEPRSTVVVDPGFYGRSQGGFGGIHVGPMVSGRASGYGVASPHVGGHSYIAASPHISGHGGG